jgi:EAL domain-containing protein (putative c-di-GMP-specific phosphodiesterase class I)
VPIGKWVIETACAQNVAWQRQGMPALRIAVNLSPRQFADPGLLGDIGNALDKSGMAPELLELEITESMVMHNIERATRVLKAIKSLGVILAIDDFGTGYSSMSLLKKFPIDVLRSTAPSCVRLPAIARTRRSQTLLSRLAEFWISPSWPRASRPLSKRLSSASTTATRFRVI